MLSREGLWQRASGAEAWGLAWALAAACGVVWALPEAWDGRVSAGLQVAGWAAVGVCLPLVRFRRWLWLPVAVTLLWGTLGGLARQARLEGALPRGPVRLQGTLVAPWFLRERSRTSALRVEAPAALRGAVLPLSLPAGGAPPPPPGTLVRFRGDLQAVVPGPVLLAERPLWRARDAGAARTLHLASALLLEPLGPPRPSPVLALRTWLHRRFQALPLSGPARDLWGALCLGIPPGHGEAFSPFVQSGTIHTLVVSGLQVTLVMGLLEALARRAFGGLARRAFGGLARRAFGGLFRRGPGAWGAWASPCAAVAGGLGYCVLVGFTAPVWRGFLMGLAWAAGKGSGWKLPPVLGLHGALLAWFMAHPAAGCDPGFLLSWLALTGLIWGAHPLAGLLGPGAGRFAGPLARVLGPWLATLPLLALFHGGAPLWGVAANLVLLPLVGVLVPACLLLVLLPVPWAVGVLDGVLVWVGGTLVPCFARVVPLATGQLAPWVALALGWILLAHLHSVFRRCRWLAVALLGLSLGLLIQRGTGGQPGTLSLEALDIGQGDALLLRVPGGDATLVDTGPDARAARRIARVLSRRGVREPVHLVLTHPHLDHAGGWAALEQVWPLASVSRPAMAPQPWEPYGPAASRARVRVLRRGDAWFRGAAEWSVRWPPRPMVLRDLNMNSLVLRVRWQDRELWLMGDALATQERDLLELGEPGPYRRGRLLKMGHHGSRSASDPAWIQALAPSLAIASAGRENRFGHPHAEALAALGRTPVFVTGACLGVRAEARPGGWFVATGTGLGLVLPAFEDTQAQEGRHQVPADAFMVGPPLPLGFGAHPVRHAQHAATGNARRVAGREDPREFQMLHSRQGPQPAGPVLRARDPGGHRHRMGLEGQVQTQGRGPPDAFAFGAIRAPFQHIHGDGQGIGGPHQVSGRQASVIGPTGAHEQDPAGRQVRQEPGRGHRRGDGAHSRAGSAPARGRSLPQARQFRREGGEEKGGAGAHDGLWYA